MYSLASSTCFVLCVKEMYRRALCAKFRAITIYAKLTKCFLTRETVSSILVLAKSALSNPKASYESITDAYS